MDATGWPAKRYATRASPFVVLVHVLAILAALAAPARANGARVAVVHYEGAGELQQRVIIRLRAELAAAGFGLTEVVRGPGDARDAAEAEPTVPGAFATIVIMPRAHDAADIWISDRITGKTVVRRVQGSAGPGHDVAAVLAVRAVELLQASLLEAMGAPSREEPAAPQAQPLPDEVSDWMQRRRPESTSRFHLGAGVDVIHSFGGVGTAILPVLGISYDLTRSLSLSLRAGAQAFSSEVEATVGTVGVRQGLAFLDVVYHLPLASTHVRPLVLLGAGLYHVDIVGTARAPYLGRTDSLTAAAFDLGVGASFPLGARVSILADIRGVLVTPKPVIRAVGEAVGRVGQPALLGELAVQVGF